MIQVTGVGDGNVPVRKVPRRSGIMKNRAVTRPMITMTTAWSDHTFTLRIMACGESKMSTGRNSARLTLRL